MRHEQRSLLLLGLLFLLFVAPFDEGAGRDLLPLTAVGVTGICLAVALLRQFLDPARPGPVKSPALLPVSVFLAVAAASVVWSIDRFVSLTGLVRVFACTVVFLAVLNNFRETVDARRLCAWLVVLAAALSLLGLWQGLMGRGLFPTATGARAHSVFVTPNTFAGFLIIALPIALTLALTEHIRAKRWALLAAAVLLLAALILSQSRGAWVMGLAAMLFLLWQLARLGLLKRKAGPALAAGLATLATLIALLALGAGLRERFLSATRPHEAASFVERFHYWGSTCDMAAQAWPLGIGLDTYHIDYPAHRHASLAGTGQWYAHNDYLQLLVELGPLGLFALLWLLWRLARMGAETLRHAPSPAEAAMVAACSAGAGAALLHSLIDFNLYVPATALSVFLCFGVIAAAHSRVFARSSEAGAGAVVAPWCRRVLSPLLLAAGTGAAVLITLPLAAQRLLNVSRFNAPLAVTICPLAANYWAYLGHLQVVAEPEAARRGYQEAIRLSPRTAAYHAYLGQLLLKNAKPDPSSADYNSGLECLRRACALDRYSAILRWWLASACLNAGRLDDGRRQLRFCLNHCRPHEKLRSLVVARLAEVARRGPERAGSDHAAHTDAHERFHPH